MAEPPVIVDFKTFDRQLVTMIDGLPYMTLSVQPCGNRGVVADRGRFAPGCGVGHGSLPQEGHASAFLPGVSLQTQKTPTDSERISPMGCGLDHSGSCHPSKPPGNVVFSCP